MLIGEDGGGIFVKEGTGAELEISRAGWSIAVGTPVGFPGIGAP